MDVTEDKTDDAGSGVTSEATQAPAKRLVVRRFDPTINSAPLVVTKAGYEAIERLARNGASNAEVARQIGVSVRAFFDLRQRDAEVDEALARGRARLEQEFVDRFVQWSRDGHVVAAIYYTKARLGWLENGSNAPGVQINNPSNVNIVIPPAMTEAQFRALVGAQDDSSKEIVIDAQATR